MTSWTLRRSLLTFDHMAFGWCSLLALNVEGELLWLSKVTRSEMGAYLCIASNGVPPSVSKRMNLQVHCKYEYSVENSGYSHTHCRPIVVICSDFLSRKRSVVPHHLKPSKSVWSGSISDITTLLAFSHFLPLCPSLYNINTYIPSTVLLHAWRRASLA